MKATILLCSLLLCACGGSGEDSGRVPGPTDSPQIIGPSSAAGGESVALILLAEGGLEQVQWQQTQGPSVSEVSAKSQVFGFDVPAAGDYGFRVNFTRQGSRQSLDWQFTAQDPQAASINIRLDHMASQGADVSLRADGDGIEDNGNLTWQQTDGPSVSFQTTGQEIYFRAPRVNRDTLLEWQAEIILDDGTRLKDTAWILVKAAPINPDGFFPRYVRQGGEIVTTEVHAYRTDSPYAEVLVSCTYTNQLDESCPFSALPMLGSETESPDIEDVLDRLVVSHDWMGENFALFLQTSPAAEDFLKLLRATTAIVISYDIRPSFYWTATGAIYLDGANFWLTPEQRDTLNTAADYRANFGDALQFQMPWRYVKDNRYYLVSYPPSLRQPRELSHMQAGLSWLLYHELAHANDFFPYFSWAGLSDAQTPLGAGNDRIASSQHLSQQYPLQSDAMAQLAQVSFFGATASEAQKSLRANDIQQFFSPDVAVTYYSYATPQEDFANTFEQFMMAYRLGVAADVAIIGTLDNEEARLTWGQRDRLNELHIQPRVASVVEDVLPGLNARSIQQQLPSPQDLPAGIPWRQTVDLTTAESPGQMKNETVRQTKPLDRPVHH